MDDLLAAARAAVAADPHALPDTTLLEQVESLLASRRLIDAALTRFLQAADIRDVTVEHTGRGTRSWLIEDQHLSGGSAGRLLKLARVLPAHPVVADALAAGQITIDHASPILRTVAKLAPADRDVDEKILVEAANDLDPDMLRTLCQATADAACCNEAVEARRERLYGSRYLTLTHTFDGMVRVEGMLDPEAGAIVQSVLEPLAQRLGPEDERSTAQRRADALATLAAAATGFDNLLPEFNGDRPHLDVITSYESLTGELARLAAHNPAADPTINGIPVSRSTVRLLACDAEIIPIVLGGQSEVLDIGRASRIWPKAIRKARQIEDRGCGWPECQMPLWACRIHHLKYWFHGGVTSKQNGVHLCRFHHWLVHHRNWAIWRNPLGKIQVART